jgi:multiple sugar transport system permease protein
MVLQAPDIVEKPMAVGTTIAPSGSIRRRTRLRRKLADNAQAYVFLAAGLLCFALFSWYPLAKGIVLSFQQDNFVTAPSFVGLDNYRAILADPLFATAWINTLEFTGLALLFGYAVPFVVALVINEFRHAKGLFRIAVYLPVMLPPIVSVLLWRYFYDPGSGLFNAILSFLHLPAAGWTQSPRMAMICLVLVSTWSNMGGATIMYLAGLANIPAELYDAVELDGASIWQRIRHVTIPQMRFVLLVLLLLQIVSTMAGVHRAVPAHWYDQSGHYHRDDPDLPVRLHGQQRLRDGGRDERLAFPRTGRILRPLPAPDESAGVRSPI